MTNYARPSVFIYVDFCHPQHLSLFQISFVRNIPFQREHRLSNDLVQAYLDFAIHILEGKEVALIWLILLVHRRTRTHRHLKPSPT
jgi:hypothetical protein